MASIKRSSSPADDSPVPAAKRPNLMASSSSSDEKHDPAVLLHQKQALLRQFRIDKQEIAKLTETVQQKTKQAEVADQNMALMTRLWRQLSQDVEQLRSRFDSSKTSVLSSDNKSSFEYMEAIKTSFTDGQDNIGQYTSPIVNLLQELISAVVSANPAQPLSFTDATSHRELSLQIKTLNDTVATQQKTIAEQAAALDDAQYELETIRRKCERLVDAQEAVSSTAKVAVVKEEGQPQQADAETKDALESANALAASRLAELETLLAQKLELAKEIEKLKTDIAQLPEAVVMATPHYRALQMRFEKYRTDFDLIKSNLDYAQKEVEQLKMKRREFLDKVEMADRQKRSLLDAEIQMLESDRIRLRAERDRFRGLFEQSNARVRGLEQLNLDWKQHIETVKEEVSVCRKENERLRGPGGSSDQELLIGELDTIVKAFDDISTQNKQLLQQLSDKEDEHTMWITEKIQLTQAQTALLKEKELLQAKVAPLQKQIKTQLEAMKKMEQRERNLAAQIDTLDKDSALRVQQLEAHRQKAAESVHMVAELSLKLNTAEAHAQQSEKRAAEKAESFERSSFSQKRQQEELATMQKQILRLRKFENGSGNEALMEELNAYKRILKCPVCERRDKQVVLTKCFHVFCQACIDARLETRQRKCPTCSDSFGVSDVKTIYL